MCLRDHVEVPEDGVGVVLLGGVEPEVDPLLAVALAAGEHVGLQDVGLPRPVAQELEVDLVVLRVLRRQLQHIAKFSISIAKAKQCRQGGRRRRAGQDILLT